MEKQPSPRGEILLYENGGEKEFVSVVFQDETFWLTQSGMAELFDCSTDNISLHLKNIYAEEAVSYTHLDVYKRQLWYCPVQTSNLPGILNKNWSRDFPGCRQ